MGVYLGHNKVANGGFIGNYDSLPVGTILPYSSKKLPIGYLLCDGREVSRTIYTSLFEAIGTTFGEGNGSTTFNLPNLKGKVPVGLSDVAGSKFNANIGTSLGEEEHKLTVGEMPSHTHDLSLATNGGSEATNKDRVALDGFGPSRWWSNLYKMGSSGGNQAHNIIQPSLVVNYIIKVSGTASLTGNVVDSLEENSTTNAPSQRAVNEIKSKKDILWAGSFKATANDTYNYMNIDKNVYDYDFLLVDVGTTIHLDNRITVVLTVEGKGVPCAVRSQLSYFIDSYCFTFGVSTDGLNKIGFKVQNSRNYSLSEIIMYRIIGVKL